MPPKRRKIVISHERTDAVARRIVVIALAVVGVALLAFVSVGMVRLYNAQSETRRCLVVRRTNIEPVTPVLPPGVEREPVAFGYVFTDTRQRLLRLHLADDYTGNGIGITGIELRGPLSADSPFEAPTALQIPPARNDVTQRFIGNATLDLRLAVHLDQNPASYYLALFSGVGGNRQEIGRDYLNKLC